MSIVPPDGTTVPSLTIAERLSFISGCGAVSSPPDSDVTAVPGSTSDEGTSRVVDPNINGNLVDTRERPFEGKDMENSNSILGDINEDALKQSGLSTTESYGPVTDRSKKKRKKPVELDLPPMPRSVILGMIKEFVRIHEPTTECPAEYLWSAFLTLLGLLFSP